MLEQVEKEAEKTLGKVGGGVVSSASRMTEASLSMSTSSSSRPRGRRARKVRKALFFLLIKLISHPKVTPMTSLMNSLATQGAGPPAEAKILAEGAKIVAEGQAAADLFGDNMGLPPDSAASSDSRSSGYHSQQELFSEGGSLAGAFMNYVAGVSKNII